MTEKEQLDMIEKIIQRGREHQTQRAKNRYKAENLCKKLLNLDPTILGTALQVYIATSRLGMSGGGIYGSAVKKAYNMLCDIECLEWS